MKFKGRNQLILACLLSVLLLFCLDALPTELAIAKQTYATSWSGGDLVIKSPRVISLPAEDVRYSESIKLSTMLIYEDQAKLVHLQLIDDKYPLYGQLQVEGNALSENSIWVDEKLARMLNIQIGDEVGLGDQVWIVSGFSNIQDEQVFDFEAFSPSVYIRLDQADNTGLIKSTSRLNHYLYFKTQDVAGLLASLGDIPADSRVIKPQESLGRVERILSEVFNMLWVIRLVGYVMAGFLMHLAFEFYCRAYAKDTGVLMALGHSRYARIKFLGMPIIYAVSIAVISAVFLLAPITAVFDYLLQSLPLGIQIPWGGVVERTVFVFFFILLALMVVHLSSLVKMPVLQLLKKGPRSINILLMVLSIVGIGVYSVTLSWDIIRVSRNILLGSSSLLLSYLLIFSIVGLIKSLLSKGGTRAYLLLNNLRLYSYEYSFVTLFMTMLLSLGLMMWHVDRQLLPSWQATLPKESANGFFIGIQPNEVAMLKKRYTWFSDATFYPVIKGRLISINDAGSQSYADGVFKDHEVLNRQLNLTALDSLPTGNTIVEGDWGEGISADSGIMQRLGLKLGDQLTFLIYGDELTLPITSIRQVDWQSMRANFYFIFNPNALANYPASYMTSTYLPKDSRSDLLSLARSFPSITYLDVELFISQARGLISGITSSVQSFLVLVTSFGIMAFFLILNRQKEQKSLQLNTMAQLGLGRRKYPVLRDELQLVLVLSICLGIATTFLGILMLDHVFNISLRFDTESLIILLVPIFVCYLFDAMYQLIYRRGDELA